MQGLICGFIYPDAFMALVRANMWFMRIICIIYPIVARALSLYGECPVAKASCIQHKYTKKRKSIDIFGDSVLSVSKKITMTDK